VELGAPDLDVVAVVQLRSIIHIRASGCKKENPKLKTNISSKYVRTKIINQNVAESMEALEDHLGTIEGKLGERVGDLGRLDAHLIAFATINITKRSENIKLMKIGRNEFDANFARRVIRRKGRGEGGNRDRDEESPNKAEITLPR